MAKRLVLPPLVQPKVLWPYEADPTKFTRSQHNEYPLLYNGSHDYRIRVTVRSDVVCDLEAPEFLLGRVFQYVHGHGSLLQLTNGIYNHLSTNDEECSNVNYVFRPAIQCPFYKCDPCAEHVHSIWIFDYDHLEMISIKRDEWLTIELQPYVQFIDAMVLGFKWNLTNYFVTKRNDELSAFQYDVRTMLFDVLPIFPSVLLCLFAEFVYYPIGWCG